MSKQTIIFHWLTGISFLLIMLIPFLPENLSSISLHKSLGALFLLLALCRVFWRIKEGWIEAVTPQNLLLSMSAKAAHILLLIATIPMPLSGVLMSVGAGRGVDIFEFVIIPESETTIGWMESLGGNIHHSSLYVLLVLIGLHVIAALKHQFIDKDNLLGRMIGR